MKDFRNNSAIIFLLCTVIIFCSCESDDKPSSEEIGSQTIENIRLGEGDASMVLATKEEFLQYIQDNYVGLTKYDLEGIDIEDIIKEYSLTVDYIGRYNWEKTLESYKLRKFLEQKATIMAKEIRSVKSTDKEYQEFVEAYLEELDIENHFLGNYYYGMSGYEIITESGRYVIYIGKTKDIDQYDVRVSSNNDICNIYLPGKDDMTMQTTFCYSNDDKFFLIVSSEKNDDFSYKLSNLFTLVNISSDESSLTKENSSIVTSERREHSTPNGGDYSEIFYFDDDGNSVDKKVATKAIIREYKKDGTLINETSADINKTE